MKPLSLRLAALVDLVLPGRPMADIGTDHGLLPVALVRSGRVPLAIGVDLAAGPLEAAQRNRVEGVVLRRGDGLAPLIPGEVATVVIAGMGGLGITAILERAILGRGDLSGVERVVTQPTEGAPIVRAWFAERGWAPVEGRLVEERGRFYFTDAWERGSRAWTPIDLRCGPRRDPPFERWLAREARTVERALAGARQGRDPDAIAALAADLALFAAASGEGRDQQG